MSRPGVRLQPLARHKVATLGEAGRDWQESLPDTLADLERLWDVRIGRALPGGSASYVCEARTAGSTGAEPRVVKVTVPDPALRDEARALRAADGRGHARLHAHDPERRAMLLERLGPSLASDPGTPERTLDALGDLLLVAWRRPDAGDPEPEWLAVGLADRVRHEQARLGHPCDPAVLRAVLEAAERRAAADDPARHVVLHGDPHPANALRVLAPRAGAETGWAFVDPDGLVGDPAYDVGVVLRDWTGRLRGGDPRRVLRGYTERLAARTGVDPDAAWEWALLERVSTGLYVLGLGSRRLGLAFLDSAVALVR